jgi:uncharacterized membrane protein
MTEKSKQRVTARRRRMRVAGTIAGSALVAGGAVIAGVAARRRTRPMVRALPRLVARVGHGRPRRFVHAITVDRPPAEVFAFWRDFRNLPRFMANVERVDVLDGGRSHWVVRAPTGTVEWDAEILGEEPGRRIAWRALGNPPLPHEGTVSFVPAPGGRGTEVRVGMIYEPAAGALGLAVARLAGQEPDQQAREDLRRLKQVLECGRIVQVDERVSGRSARQQKATALLRRRMARGGRP